MSLPFPAPKTKTGFVIFIGKVEVKPGKGDEVAAYLAQIRAAAESAAEPDTLTYRTTRHEGDADKFLVFEEYKLPNGIVEHLQGEAFKALGAADLIAKLEPGYYVEFK